MPISNSVAFEATARLPIITRTTPKQDTMEIPYEEWNREDLEAGIAEVKQMISALEVELAEEAERKRQEVERLKADIQEVKAKLRALGVEVLELIAKRRRTPTNSGSVNRVVKRNNGGRRKTTQGVAVIKYKVDLDGIVTDASLLSTDCMLAPQDE